MKKSDPVPAHFWWQSAANQFDKVIREFLKRAKAAELRDMGHDCGHEFTITVSSQMHISGPGEHSDADYSDEVTPVTVRAHNLRDALLLAAAEPLTSWFKDLEEKSNG